MPSSAADPLVALATSLAPLLRLETKSLVDRLKNLTVAWTLVGVLVLLCCVFLLVAANAALTTQLGPIIAPLVIAGAALLLALVVYGVARLRTAAMKRQNAERRRSAETTALVAGAAISAMPELLKSPMLKQIGIPLGGVIIAAFLLTRPSGKPD